MLVRCDPGCDRQVVQLGAAGVGLVATTSRSDRIDGPYDTLLGVDPCQRRTPDGLLASQVRPAFGPSANFEIEGLSPLLCCIGSCSLLILRFSR